MATGAKAAIVTGAASGLGRAMALGLAEDGIDVLAVDQNAPALAALATAAAGRRGSVLTHQADLARAEAFDGIVAAAPALSASGRFWLTFHLPMSRAIGPSMPTRAPTIASMKSAGASVTCQGSRRPASCRSVSRSTKARSHARSSMTRSVPCAWTTT